MMKVVGIMMKIIGYTLLNVLVLGAHTFGAAYAVRDLIHFYDGSKDL